MILPRLSLADIVGYIKSYVQMSFCIVITILLFFTVSFVMIFEAYILIYR